MERQKEETERNLQSQLQNCQENLGHKCDENDRLKNQIEKIYKEGAEEKAMIIAKENEKKVKVSKLFSVCGIFSLQDFFSTFDEY